MRYFSHLRRYLSIFITIQMIFLGIFSGSTLIAPGVESNSEIMPVTENNHVTSDIWEYTNQLNHPENGLKLTLNNNKWEALVAAAIVPVFITRSSSTPLLYSDGFEDEEEEPELIKDTRSVSSFGTDPQSATSKLATNYWSIAELIFVVDDYEQVLWVVPSASFLSAPILVSPTIETISSLGTKCAIQVGRTEPDVDKVIKLSTKESVWRFQLELFDTKGENCNYIIITNPHDANDIIDPNVKWPFMSLATAPLSAFRHSLVQTNNYTADKDILLEINGAQGRLDDVYQQARPYFENVKTDSYTAVQYLLKNDQTPEYMALVGGAFALPDYYFDMHAYFKYWDQELHYVPSSGPYANISEEYPVNISIKEDLGIGRIVGHSIFDATLMLAKTFFYNDFLPGGKYYDSYPTNWEKNTAVVDGHRLNQPRPGGPPNESAANPYYPGGEILEIQKSENFDSSYYLPRNDSDPYDTNLTVSSILKELEEKSMVQVLAHGASMINSKSIWLEAGDDPITGEGKRKYITSQDVSKLKLPPSLYYFIACHTGHIFLEQKMGEYFPLAFIHSGSVAFIAPVTCQSICFWYKAPFGPASTQAMLFWENILDKHMSVGNALANAKWSAYQQWFAQHPDDPRIEPDGPAFHLFGDPALKLFVPSSELDHEKKMDVEIKITYSSSAQSVTIDVLSYDLTTGHTIGSADKDLDIDIDIQITYNGLKQRGSEATFNAPKQDGEYTIEVRVEAIDYETVNAKAWHQLGEEKEDTKTNKDTGLGVSNLWLWIIIGVVFIILIVIVTAIKFKKPTKK